jgi:N-acetylglucosamine kinase-like BadF-type ATPase
MAEEQPYYLGIEATGRTVALLAGPDGEIVGEGTATSAVYSVMGQERSSQALWSAIIGAFSSAGINTRDLLQANQTLPDVAAICVGMSGVERPKDESQVRRILDRFNLTKNIVVTSDAHIVLEAGCNLENFSDPAYGVAVLAGENGLAFAKGRDGRTARAGGWGYLLGEEGSAYWLGLQAVKALLRAADGRGDPTALAAMVEHEWKIPANRPDSLAQRVYSLLAGLGTGGNKAQLEESQENYKRTLAGLAPLVERAAATGDEVAAAILDEATGHLAGAATAALARVGLDGTVSTATPTPTPTQAKNPTFQIGGMAFNLGQPAQAKIPFAIYGSVLLSNPGQLRARLQEALPQCDDPLAVLNPAEGAVRLALRFQGRN